MTTINRSALFPYRAAQLFDLVNDVEAYPTFMEGCVGARVLRRTDEFMEARLDLARAGISQSFSTRNKMIEARQITLQLLEGPFEYLEGRWDFLALGDAACKLSLQLDFRVNSALLGAAASRLLDSVTGNLVDAIGRRARQLYG